MSWCQIPALHPARCGHFCVDSQTVFPENEHQDSTGPIEAEVKWYNSRKGFGFVLGPDGQDVFFHASALTEAGIEPPDTGDKLVCEIGSDRQGRRLHQAALPCRASICRRAPISRPGSPA